MKDEPDEPEKSDEAAPEDEDARLRALVRGAMKKSASASPPPEALRGALQPPPGSVAPNLLRGVHKRLRVRSRGKFYGDGWSTAESPKTTYLVTSVLMLVLVALIFLILVPWSSTKLP